MYPGESSKSLHIGIDIVAKKGTPVTSITAGTVVFAGEDARGGGLMVSVKSYHRGKLKLIRYMHLSKLFVKRGAYVNHKTILGRVGSTGRSTGPHLHIEMAIVRNGKKPKYDDPSKYLCAYKNGYSYCQKNEWKTQVRDAQRTPPAEKKAKKKSKNTKKN